MCLQEPAKTEEALEGAVLSPPGPMQPGESGMDGEIGTDIYTLLCMKWMAGEGLLYSTGGKKRRYNLFAGHILS